MTDWRLSAKGDYDLTFLYVVSSTEAESLCFRNISQVFLIALHQAQDGPLILLSDESLEVLPRDESGITKAHIVAYGRMIRVHSGSSMTWRLAFLN
jgi:hypothetical protein